MRRTIHDTTLTIRLPKPLKAALVSVADAMNRHPAELARTAVTAFLTTQKPTERVLP